jgi:uncharacterized protein with GYD domain
MATYVLTTRLAPEAIRDPRGYEELGRKVVEAINAECPEVRWLASYAILGPYDYLDVFEAPDNDAAIKVGAIVRSFGHATTETWPATPWERFREIIHQVKGAPAAEHVWLPTEAAESAPAH